MNYKHLSIDEREKILFYLADELSLCKIAHRLGRNKSTTKANRAIAKTT